MPIESIEAIPLAIPFRHDGPPTGFAGGTWITANYLLIKVTTSDGIIGWGEAFGYGAIPATQAVVERQLAPLAVGILGIIIERLFLRHLYQLEPIYGLLLTFGIALIAEGIMRSLFGASGKSYLIQTTTNLTTQVWSTLGTSTADGNGRFIWFTGQTNGPSAFYRSLRID